MRRVQDMVRSPAVIFNIVEIILCALCTGICPEELFAIESVAKLEVLHGTFIGFLMVGIVLVLGHLMETPLHNSATVGVSCVAAFMFLTCGALLIDTHVNKWELDRIIAAGVIAIINCFVYILDAALTHRSTE